MVEVGLGSGHIVLDGNPAPLPKRGQSRPPFSALFYYDQMAGCIKMPLGMDVNLGPGHVALDGVPALRERGTAGRPFFQPMSIVATVAHLSYC